MLPTVNYLHKTYSNPNSWTGVELQVPCRTGLLTKAPSPFHSPSPGTAGSAKWTAQPLFPALRLLFERVKLVLQRSQNVWPNQVWRVEVAQGVMKLAAKHDWEANATADAFD